MAIHPHTDTQSDRRTDTGTAVFCSSLQREANYENTKRMRMKNYYQRPACQTWCMFVIGVLIPEGYVQSTWPLTHVHQMAPTSFWPSAAARSWNMSTSQGIAQCCAALNAWGISWNLSFRFALRASTSLISSHSTSSELCVVQASTHGIAVSPLANSSKTKPCANQCRQL